MPATSPRSEDEQSIRRLGDEWEKAVEARDLDRILSLVTDDVVFMPPGAPAIEGKRALEETYRAFFARYSIKQTFAPEEIKISGDWAFTRGADVLTLVPLDGNLPVVVRARGISILKRDESGSWQFARGITNLDHPPEQVGGI